MPICSTMRFRAMSASIQVTPTLVSLNPAGEPRAGVRGMINREQALALDRSVALGRRQAGMTQKLLNGAEITAGTEQVSSKAVTQSVRRRAFGEPEQPAHSLHPALHETGIEGPAT